MVAVPGYRQQSREGRAGSCSARNDDYNIVVRRSSKALWVEEEIKNEEESRAVAQIA